LRAGRERQDEDDGSEHCYRAPGTRIAVVTSACR
jgi:hypothetical protein